MFKALYNHKNKINLNTILRVIQFGICFLVCQIKPISNLLVYIAKGKINGDRFDFENNLLLYYIIYCILHVLLPKKNGEKRFSYLKDV